MDFFSWVFLLISCVSVTIANELARGWNDDVDWVKLDDGLKTAKEQNKPIMLIIHKSWCGACKALKPQFHTSKVIAELSKNFVMVNSLDDEEPSGEKYTPDGGYIPRILFYDPEGNLLEQYKNTNGHPDYKYYHHSPETNTMKAVIKDRNLKPTNEEL